LLSEGLDYGVVLTVKYAFIEKKSEVRLALTSALPTGLTIITQLLLTRIVDHLLCIDRGHAKTRARFTGKES
jgi:hypothetical protein